MVGLANNNGLGREYIRNWYRQSVLDQMFELFFSWAENCLDIDDDNFEVENQNPLYIPVLIKEHGTELFGSAISLFGSWENALKHAGLSENINKTSSRFNAQYWSAENVLEQIKILYNNRFDLSASFIRRVYPELYYTARDRENFGSWSAAIVEAEIEYRTLYQVSRRFWTADRILTTIIDIEDAVGNIQPNTISKIHPTLYSAANRYFKNWSLAVEKAGLNLTKNLVKVCLEPFRDYLVIENLKKVFDAIKVNYKITSLKSEPEQFENTIGQNGSRKIQDRAKDIEDKNLKVNNDQIAQTLINELYDNEIYQQNQQIIIEDNGSTVLLVPKYRCWGIGLERIIEKLLLEYPKIVLYYSIGDGREWCNDSVRFENINRYYSQLISIGRDDIIAELGLLARGGVPKGYQEHFEKIMSNIKKILS